MKAFHDDPAIKEKYLQRVTAHEAADEIIKGTYWENGKGCAVGCSIHSGNHKDYETELGIPEWLARVEDTIFEGLPNDRAKKWPREFLDSITPGQDLEKIKAPFLIFVLEFALETFDHEKFPDVKKSINDVIHLYASNKTDLNKYSEAAWTEAGAARAAAWAAWAAEAAAGEVKAAARAATWAAEAARAARAEAGEAYVKFADKILELIRQKK